MVLIELSDENSVRKYVRARLREYEARYSPDSVYFTDLKGMWSFALLTEILPGAPRILPRLEQPGK